MAARAAYWTLFASLLPVSLMLVPGGAHLPVLPNKIYMGAADYRVAQRAYRGWALTGVFAGVFAFGALVATAAFAYTVRHMRDIRGLALAALVCLIATQALFWTLNFPASRQTENWTTLPSD